jgi:coenzyme F420-reducing hydrogenase gamma subunit
MGALKSNELLEFFDWAEKKEKFVVATACACHGFFTALKRVPRDKAER